MPCCQQLPPVFLFYPFSFLPPIFSLDIYSNHEEESFLLDWIAPDIVLEDKDDSDVFMATIYHELAHASQYTLVGECYWKKVRAHETLMYIATDLDSSQDADPYGDPTNPPNPSSLYENYPIVAMAESWGEHVGVLYTVRKYGTITISGFSTLTWPFFLERRLTIKNNFIPEGLHWDLMDGVNSNDGTTVGDGVLINDTAGGSTLVELYNLLDNETPSEYRQDVIDNTSATGDILNLFSEYGY